MGKVDTSVSNASPGVECLVPTSVKSPDSFSSIVSNLTLAGTTQGAPDDGLGGPNPGGSTPAVNPLPPPGLSPVGSGGAAPVGGMPQSYDMGSARYQKTHPAITHAKQNINQLLDLAKSQFADGNVSAGIYTQNTVKSLQTLLSSLIANGHDGHLTGAGVDVIRESIGNAATRLGGITLVHPYPSPDSGSPVPKDHPVCGKINQAMADLVAMKGGAASVDAQRIEILNLEASMLKASATPDKLSKASIELLKERVNGCYSFQGEPPPFS